MTQSTISIDSLSDATNLSHSQPVIASANRKQASPQQASLEPTQMTENSPKPNTRSRYFNLDDPESVRLSMQVVLSLTTVIFCSFGIAMHEINNKQDNIALYWGGVTGILAWWMPSPASKPKP